MLTKHAMVMELGAFQDVEDFVVFECQLDALPDNNERFLLSAENHEEMGNPQYITVTVEAGDQLSTPESQIIASATITK